MLQILILRTSREKPRPGYCRYIFVWANLGELGFTGFGAGAPKNWPRPLSLVLRRPSMFHRVGLRKLTFTEPSAGQGATGGTKVEGKKTNFTSIWKFVFLPSTLASPVAPCSRSVP